MAAALGASSSGLWLVDETSQAAVLKRGVGYSEQKQSITAAAGQETTADFAAPSGGRLGRVTWAKASRCSRARISAKRADSWNPLCSSSGCVEA